MNELAWRARNWLDGIGWHGTTGLALLAFSAMLAATAISARVGELDAVRTEVERLQARYLMSGGVQGQGKASREDQLQSFYGFFPPLSTLPDWLERIYAAADKNGVTLETGEYKLVQERGWKLSRYQLTLPVRGSYGQIRGFIAQVLTEVPAAALDEVGFRRETIGSERLDARLRLTLYLGRA